MCTPLKATSLDKLMRHLILNRSWLQRMAGCKLWTRTKGEGFLVKCHYFKNLEYHISSAITNYVSKDRGRDRAIVYKTDNARHLAEVVVTLPLIDNTVTDAAWGSFYGGVHIPGGPPQHARRLRKSLCSDSYVR